MSKKITGDEPANILTIRQEFAARIMQGLVSNSHPKMVEVDVPWLVETALKLSGALIAELNKEVNQ